MTSTVNDLNLDVAPAPLAICFVKSKCVKSGRRQSCLSSVFYYYVFNGVVLVGRDSVCCL